MICPFTGNSSEHLLGADLWEGDAPKTLSVQQKAFFIQWKRKEAFSEWGVWQLSGLIRANQFSQKQKTLFCESTFQKTDSANHANLNANRREDAIRANLAKCFKKKGFCCESIRANLRNVGVRIACPLSLVRISTGKAIQCRGPGHSVNRWTLKIESCCPHLLPKKQLLFYARCSATCEVHFLAFYTIFYSIKCQKCRLKKCS